VPNLKFVPLVIFELLAFNAQKIEGSRDPGHAPFSKKFFSGHVGIFPGSIQASVPNLKFVSLVVLELLAFNAKKFKGTRDPGHAPFSKNFLGVTSGLSLGASVPNLKFIPSTVLKLLAFNAQILQGHVTLATAPFTLF